MNKGILYLLPCPIGESGNGRSELSGDSAFDRAPVRDSSYPFDDVLPAANFEVMRRLDYFIVEDVRSARRFLSRAGMGPVERLEFVELNEHTRPGEIAGMLAPLLAGRSAGVIAEAGVPAVADPGSDMVAAAHRAGVRVVPLVGPSSVLMALMSSGLNGQSFAFNGYLPVKPPERTRAVKHFERRAVTEHQAQIFIETPYRNGRLFEELLASCAPETRLCVAVDISGPGEFIRTATIAEWRCSSVPELHKRPAIFILG